MIQKLSNNIVGSANEKDEDSAIPDFRRTKMTGVRSAGFFPNPAAPQTLDGTFKYPTTNNGKEEFPARNINLKPTVEVEQFDSR